MPAFWQVHSIGGASPRHPLLLQFPYKYTRAAKYTRTESYGRPKAFSNTRIKAVPAVLVFFSKYSTLNHSEAPCRKAKTRNCMNWTSNITNLPVLPDRTACKGSPSERLVNTRNFMLLSRNQKNREHLSQQELNPWLFHFYFLISFGNHAPQQILVNISNKLVVGKLYFS